VSQKLWHFFSRNLNCPSILIRSCPMWHYSNLMLSLLHLVIFKHPISLIQSPILEIFHIMNSALHFLHIYRLDFHLKEKILLSIFEKIPWSNKFLQSPILEIFHAMNSALHFLHIYHLDFYLKKNILPSIFEKIPWSNKFLMVPPCRNYFV
jgi:hypothetical protein